MSLQDLLSNLLALIVIAAGIGIVFSLFQGIFTFVFGPHDGGLFSSFGRRILFLALGTFLLIFLLSLIANVLTNIGVSGAQAFAPSAIFLKVGQMLSALLSFSRSLQ